MELRQSIYPSSEKFFSCSEKLFLAPYKCSRAATASVKWSAIVENPDNKTV